jgi:hypothetical protein
VRLQASNVGALLLIVDLVAPFIAWSQHKFNISSLPNLSLFFSLFPSHCLFPPREILISFKEWMLVVIWIHYSLEGKSWPISHCALIVKSLHKFWKDVQFEEFHRYSITLLSSSSFASFLAKKTRVLYYEAWRVLLGEQLHEEYWGVTKLMPCVKSKGHGQVIEGFLNILSS